MKVPQPEQNPKDEGSLERKKNLLELVDIKRDLTSTDIMGLKEEDIFVPSDISDPEIKTALQIQIARQFLQYGAMHVKSLQEIFHFDENYLNESIKLALGSVVKNFDEAIILKNVIDYFPNSKEFILNFFASDAYHIFFSITKDDHSTATFLKELGRIGFESDIFFESIEEKLDIILSDEQKLKRLLTIVKQLDLGDKLRQIIEVKQKTELDKYIQLGIPNQVALNLITQDKEVKKLFLTGIQEFGLDNILGLLNVAVEEHNKNRIFYNMLPQIYWVTYSDKISKEEVLQNLSKISTQRELTNFESELRQFDKTRFLAAKQYFDKICDFLGEETVKEVFGKIFAQHTTYKYDFNSSFTYDSNGYYFEWAENIKKFTKEELLPLFKRIDSETVFDWFVKTINEFDPDIAEKAKKSHLQLEEKVGKKFIDSLLLRVGIKSPVSRLDYSKYSYLFVWIDDIDNTLTGEEIKNEMDKIKSMNDFTAFNGLMRSYNYDQADSARNLKKQIENLVGQEVIADFCSKMKITLNGNLETYLAWSYFDWVPKIQDISGIELAEEIKKIKNYSDYSRFNSKITSYNAESAKEVINWHKKAVEFIGEKNIGTFTEKFNFTLNGNFDFYNAHDYFLWAQHLDEEKKLSSKEVVQILSTISDIDSLNKFSSLLQSYDKQKDVGLLKEAQEEYKPIRSMRELEKRVKMITTNFDWKTIPEKYRSKIKQIAMSAPGFDFRSLTKYFGDKMTSDKMVELMEENFPNWIKPRAVSYYLLEDVLGREFDTTGGKKPNSKLFGELRKYLTKKELDEGRRVSNEETKERIRKLLEKVPKEIESDILDILKNLKIDLGDEYIATIHSKSDPEGWVVGNWTDCCMPFGDSKNTDYMFNTACQYFSVKIKDTTGEERIIAQSVMVDSADKKTKEDILLLDNIEVANSHKNKSTQLSYVYNRFWSENSEGRPVKIGAGYLDLIPTGAKIESNNVRPKKKISYSDATGENIYNLPKMEDFGNKNEPVFANLTERDVDVISKLEEEIYSDNRGLQLGKGRAKEVIDSQRDLQVPGAASSFVTRINNKPVGYLLVLPDESEVNKGERVAHIQDLAIKKEFQNNILSRKMLGRVLDAAKAYNLPAIELEARESTSFALLKTKFVQRWLIKNGFSLKFYNEEMKEVNVDEAKPNPKNQLGGENFYFIRLENNNFDQNRQVNFEQTNYNQVAEGYF